MNDYCLNQSQGLKAQQDTSTHLFHWVSLLQNNHHLPPLPPPPIYLPLGDVFLINKKMKHEDYRETSI